MTHFCVKFIRHIANVRVTDFVCLVTELGHEETIYALFG